MAAQRKAVSRRMKAYCCQERGEGRVVGGASPSTTRIRALDGPAAINHQRYAGKQKASMPFIRPVLLQALSNEPTKSATVHQSNRRQLADEFERDRHGVIATTVIARRYYLLSAATFKASISSSTKSRPNDDRRCACELLASFLDAGSCAPTMRACSPSFTQRAGSGSSRPCSVSRWSSPPARSCGPGSGRRPRRRSRRSRGLNRKSK